MNQTNKCKEDCVCKIEGKTHSFNDGCGCPMHNGEEFDTSPKEETYCRYGAKNCFDHPPKEEIVNDWEIFLICRWQQLRDFYGRELSPKDLKNSIEYIISSTEKRVKEEERQFILNILDGIDKADEEMGNTGGGTKAIRLALKSRI